MPRIRGSPQDLYEFREAVQEALASTGMSVSELARRAGVGREHLSRILMPEYKGGPPSASLRLSVAIALADASVPDNLLQRVAGVDQLLRSSSIRKVPSPGDLYTLASRDSFAASRLRAFVREYLATQIVSLPERHRRQWFLEFVLSWVRRALFGSEGPLGELRERAGQGDGMLYALIDRDNFCFVVDELRDALTTTALVLAACSWRDPWLLYPFSQRHPAQVHVLPYRDRLPKEIAEILRDPGP